jgi:hypothetical protein
LCKGEKTVWRLVANPKEPKSYFHPLASVDGEELTAFQPADHPSPWYVHDSRPMSYFSPAVLFNKPLILDAGQSLNSVTAS